MATVPNNAAWSTQGVVPMSPARKKSSRVVLHRIAEVREQQGVSLRSAARQIGKDVRELRRQEDEASNLTLTELYAWQQALGVPVVDLLVEPDPTLSRPILERARLVKVMKTVKALQEVSRTAATQRLVQTLIEQLTEIMPELAEVGAWHSVGQRRSLNEFGKAAERLFSEESFRTQDWD